MCAVLELLLHLQELLLQQWFDIQFFGKVDSAIVWQHRDWRHFFVTIAIHLKQKSSVSNTNACPHVSEECSKQPRVSSDKCVKEVRAEITSS